MTALRHDPLKRLLRLEQNLFPMCHKQHPLEPLREETRQIRFAKPGRHDDHRLVVLLLHRAMECFKRIQLRQTRLDRHKRKLGGFFLLVLR
ncbi:hypothetical protein D3C74_355160 [compost metagenome]